MRAVPIGLLVVSFLVADARATEWIVAKDGSGQFSEIQPAVDAAQNGDEIWVLAGAYGPAIIAQKTIAVLGAGAGSASITSLRIETTPPGFTSVSGLTISQTTTVTANVGTVVLRDCVGQNLAVTNCPRVFVENWHGLRGSCNNVGGLWIAESSFAGGTGKDALPGAVPGTWSQLPTPGLSAFGARTSKLFISNTEFAGGAGGMGSCQATLGYLAGAPGGAGLHDETGGCSFWLARSTFTPGAGGTGLAACTPQPGAVGVKTLPTTQLLWDEQGAELFPLSILTPSLLGQSTLIEVWGHPNDNIILLIDPNPATTVTSPTPGFPLGLNLTPGVVNIWPLQRTIGLGGSLLWKHKIPSDPALLGTPVFLQAVLTSPTGGPAHVPVLTGVSVSVLTE
jgi:hypothetical protein